MQTSLGQTRYSAHTTTHEAYTNGHTTNGISSSPPSFELDALVVGAGFSGCYLLHLLRKEGFSVKIVEAGTGLGGIWHWNSYPGARVDSQYPIYQYSLPEIYKDWVWSEEYPGSAELRDYFRHVDKQLDLSRDVVFNTKVVEARFDDASDKWVVSCDNGTTFTTRFFLPCAGFAAKRHFPDWPGLETFKGTVCHSSFWPEQGMDVKGKRVAVVGTGATGIQIAQTVAREAAHLTVFQRTPNMCCPMRQARLTPEQITQDHLSMDDTMLLRYSTYAGFLYEPQRQLKTFDHTAEEREAFFTKLWDMGGFRLLANNYSDMLSDAKANREAYDFWARKTRERITDPRKRDILAPLDPPHPFGGKRLSLEQDFYEQMNKSSVDVVDLKATPISHVTPTGIVTADNNHHNFDIIAIATGFDSFTGGLKDMNVSGVKGRKLNDKWRDGTYTAYGMAVHGFPNLFFLYGPQAPTAYANGPSITEPQARWVLKVMKLMRGDDRQSTAFSLIKPVPNEVPTSDSGMTNGVNGVDTAQTNGIDTPKPNGLSPIPNGYHDAATNGVNGAHPTSNHSPTSPPTQWKHTHLNPKLPIELFWKQRVNDLHTLTLRNDVDSWYMGTNIPGKPREALNYSGGIPEYLEWLEGAIVEEDGGWRGFEVR